MTINFFQYAVTLALNLDKINDHPERISKIKPFIGEYNWIFHPQVMIGKNLNQTMKLHLIFCTCLIILKKIEIAYKSKHNLTREKQVILLIISKKSLKHTKKYVKIAIIVT